MNLTYIFYFEIRVTLRKHEEMYSLIFLLFGLRRNMKQQSVFPRVIAVNLVAVGCDSQVPECAM